VDLLRQHEVTTTKTETPPSGKMHNPPPKGKRGTEIWLIPETIEHEQGGNEIVLNIVRGNVRLKMNQPQEKKKGGKVFRESELLM